MSGGQTEISARLRELRLLHFGPRGRSRFARALGIRPSTYSHYEVDRLPPVDLLAQVARITGTSLEWIITGEGSRHAARSSSPLNSQAAVADRLVRLLVARPELVSVVTRYLETLEGVLERPRQPSAVESCSSAALIPLVGSTAAGPARFWEELPALAAGPEVDARIERLIAHEQARSAMHGAVFSTMHEPEAGGPVALVQCAAPDDQGVLEFVWAASVKARYPSAVAWRIDGDSMAPRYRDGDLVITSPEHPAVEHQPCVARQKGQIGVNCKIFRRGEADDILLIPINEQYPIQRIPASALVWASRVLCSIRLG